MNVYQKLNAARGDFHHTKLKKTGHNKFANYYYFELGDFLIPALQIFNDHGILAVISFGKEIATMKIIDAFNPEDRIIITSPMSTAALKGCHEVQNLGAVQTYLRRYLWVAALEIVEHDALDQPVSEQNIPEGKDKIVITPSQGIAETLSTEDLQYLQELAIELVANVAEGNPKQALERLDKENLEADQKVGLWSMLDSKTRSAIKKAKEI